VVRGSVDRDALGSVLGLQASQRIVLARSVGHARPEQHRRRHRMSIPLFRDQGGIE